MRLLPRLLYVGDVPVEASYHGAALLHRLLSDYPPEKLTIMETATESASHRRLPNVNYLGHQIGRPRWLNTRLHPYAVAWFTTSGSRSAKRISQSFNGFECEGVLTVAHGFGWLAAAELANRKKIPLHLLVHDDWPRVADIAPGFRSWLDRRFAHVYLQAHSRLCVSPSMSRSYEERYGAPARVIYPGRAPGCSEPDDPPARLGNNDKPFTIAFAGTINSDGYIDSLLALQQALKPANGRLLIFGPLTDAEAKRIGLDDENTSIGGLLSSAQLLEQLRSQADALFVPMSFAARDRDNMEMAFPSKLADYTATGLPLLIYGPGYCSAVAWARANPGVAAVVDDEKELDATLLRLANDPAWRIALGRRALRVGRDYFSHQRAQDVFHRALVS